MANISLQQTHDLSLHHFILQIVSPYNVIIHYIYLEKQ